MDIAWFECRAQKVTLSSVSLFGGAISASIVQATDGKGTATGLEIDGAAVTAAAGETLPVEDWGELTLGTTVGRVRAPLVVRLLQAHDSLPAGTAVAVGFAASPVAKPISEHPQLAQTAQKQHGSSGATKQSAAAHHAKKHGRRRRKAPDFPKSAYPFLVGGDLGPALAHNPVVSLAMQYLGIPYQWGGASPKTGFDCSGLVKYVFAQLGVSLPHFAAAQWYSPDAVWVRPNRLQPGDLVFFTGSDGTRKAPGHVGIYIGDGYLIDAPHTGAFVQIDSLKERWFAKTTSARSASASRSSPATWPQWPRRGQTVTAISARFLPHLTIERLGDSLGIADPGAAVVPDCVGGRVPDRVERLPGLGRRRPRRPAPHAPRRRDVLAPPRAVAGDLRELWRRRVTSRNL